MPTLVGDTDYQIQPNDRLVIVGEPLTAPRTWTFPAGGSFDNDRLQVVDGCGGVSAENTITFVAPDALINGEASWTLSAAWGTVVFTKIAPNLWQATSADQDAAEGATQLSGLKVRNLTFNFATPDIDTGVDLVVPAAGEMIVALVGAVTQAWASSVSDEVDLGVTGGTDDFLDGGDAQVLGPLAIADAVGYVFDGIVALTAVVVSSGDADDVGIVSLTLITAPATLPV